MFRCAHPGCPAPRVDGPRFRFCAEHGKPKWVARRHRAKYGRAPHKEVAPRSVEAIRADLAGLLRTAVGRLDTMVAADRAAESRRSAA